MLNRIWFWLKNSRVFTVPMSIFSWLVVFVYAATQGGNIFYGILCLIGICFGQLATNLTDDYMDYKLLVKTGELQSNIKSKCEYITNGEATLEQTLRVICIYCGIAFLIGVFLFFKTGYPVIIFAVLGGIPVLTYSLISTAGFGEFAVGFVYGPVLFGGVYWTMMQSLNLEVFVLSAIVVMFVIAQLYTNNMLDYDGDKATNKKTLCSRFPTKDMAAIIGYGLLFCLGYGILILAVILQIFPPVYLITLFTVPMAADVVISMLMFNSDKTSVPKRKPWYFPMENMKSITEKGIAPFMVRMYQTRNTMIYTSLFLCIAIIISR